MLQIEFQWWRDPKGYRLMSAEPPDQVKAAKPGWAPDHGRPARVIRGGGKLVPYQPLAGRVPLCRVFAEVTSPEGLLRFIKHYGPLTKDGLNPDVGEAVRDILPRAALMKRMILALSDHRQLARMILALPKLPDLEPTLALDPNTKTPRLKHSIASNRGLLSALWLQLAQVLAGGVEIRSCAKCGKLFEAGVGTDRRSGAKFCSDEHRVLFNSLNRAKEKE